MTIANSLCRYLVEQGCIAPLCELLTLTDAKTVQVALKGIDNILKAGHRHDCRDNPYAVLIEECFGASCAGRRSVPMDGAR